MVIVTPTPLGLATELSLKALHMREDGTFPKSHDLLERFDPLPARTRRRFEQKMPESAGSTPRPTVGVPLHSRGAEVGTLIKHLASRTSFGLAGNATLHLLSMRGPRRRPAAPRCRPACRPPRGATTRATSSPSLTGLPRHLHEAVYCACARAEDLIKQHKGQLANEFHLDLPQRCPVPHAGTPAHRRGPLTDSAPCPASPNLCALKIK